MRFFVGLLYVLYIFPNFNHFRIMDAPIDIPIAQIRVYGALRYNVHTMASLLNVPAEYLQQELDNPSSQIAKEYKKGKNQADYNADTELLKNAQKGDVESIVALSHREHDRKVDDLKRDLFGL
jgi:hypothetical protein